MLKEKQHRYDLAYMKMADAWSKLSYAKRMQVGAIIVKDQQIISDGFNGMPSGMDNCCEGSDGLTKREVLHAEANAICKLARSTGSSEGATLYCTLSPCVECAKLILQSGITRIIFRETYEDEAGILLLHNNRREVKGVRWRSSLST